MATLTIIGLGSGSADDLTRRAWRALEATPRLILRTRRHPCVPDLPRSAQAESCDDLYEQYARFEDVYNAIVDRVLSACQQGDVAYAVPGDPTVGEATTWRLLSAAQAQGHHVELIHGLSFIEPSLRYAQVDAMNGLQIVDGLDVAAQHHPQINPDYPCLIGQVYSRDVASDVKLTLMNQYADDFEVVLIHGAGSDSPRVERCPLYQIDRSKHISHLTTLYLPALGQRSSFEAFQEIIAHLRAPEGCPWDRKQTHESLRPYLLEETYEVLEAIDKGDWDELASELGDLLLQVVLHTQIAIDEGEFTMTDVLRRVSAKMIRRHPHVWGEVDVDDDSEQVKANWEEIKRAERAAKGQAERGLLEGVNQAAPALLVAYELTRKAAQVGFDWPDVEGVRAKAREELAEALQAESSAEQVEELGDLLFVLVNWLRKLGEDDPESLLRRVNAKFVRRFGYVEQMARQQGRDLATMTLAEMDALWDEGKRRGL
ncbi:MAG: nucleoside triphosphate pyrophosphohydrolase [Anaerolineae bacterium]|nr:nucleoside triphosphate pyrophosphohydrolase [Anaerolineae bacterium]MDW8171696.1 nucleoside triphosphate pyrophosphohydrolase [Anaerolineae bacterium]